MQAKPRIQPHEPTVFDYVPERLKRPLVLIACGNRMALGAGTVFLVRHQDGHLCTEFCQLKRACFC